MKGERTQLKEEIKMMGNAQIVIITVNVNGMNSPIKWKWIAKWIKTQNPTMCCLQETHIRQGGTHRVKVMVWIRIYCSSSKILKSKSSHHDLRQSKSKF